MVSNQAPSSISVNGWNQTLHLTTSHYRVVSGSVMPSVFPALRGCHGRCAGCSQHKDTCPGSKGRPHSSPHSAPQVAFTQSKEHLLLVCSKVQYGQPPRPCPIHIPSSPLCPFPPAVPSLRQDPRAACTGRLAGGSSCCGGLVLFLSLAMRRAASPNCSAVINTAVRSDESVFASWRQRQNADADYSRSSGHGPFRAPSS